MSNKNGGTMNTKIEDIYEIFKTISLLSYKINYNKLEKIGLYPGQPILIEKIYENEGISQRELSDVSFKKPATITTMINKLEINGYIKRKSDVNDKRIIKLYLTDLGKEKYYEMKKLKKSIGNIYFSNMTDEEISNMYNLLLKIKDNLEKY